MPPSFTRGTVVALGVLSLLLIVGPARLASDTTSVSAAPAPHDHASHDSSSVAQEDLGGAALGEPCAASGLIPVGDTGLCTHGPDPAPPRRRGRRR